MASSVSKCIVWLVVVGMLLQVVCAAPLVRRFGSGEVVEVVVSDVREVDGGDGRMMVFAVFSVLVLVNVLLFVLVLRLRRSVVGT
jgi:hypothetical protein